MNNSRMISNADTKNEQPLSEYQEKSFYLVKRYSRQMLVPHMDGLAGQTALDNSRVLVVGAGGIGSSLILYLAGAGVGHITIVDFDTIEESNLHRQVIHDTSGASLRTSKAESAANRVHALNPHISCKVVRLKMTRNNVIDIMKDNIQVVTDNAKRTNQDEEQNNNSNSSPYDAVMDATDNFDARYIINDACNHLKLPLVSGSAVGMEGQVTVFCPGSDSACYQCLHPNPSPTEACRSCDNAGVLGPVPGLIGTLQALEVIKLLVKSKIPPTSVTHSRKLKNLIGRQLYFDAVTSEFHEFKLPKRNKTCISCQHIYNDTNESVSTLSVFPLETPTFIPPSLPSLSSEYRISASEYFSTILQRKIPHVLLDVRSSLQYSIISLKYLLEDSSSNVDLINIPFSELKASFLKGNDGAAVHTMKAAVSSGNTSVGDSGDDSNLHNDLGVATTALPVFVLCRRGIDSVRAVHLLQSADTELMGVFSKQGQVFNIEGGLNAWHDEVDSSFPRY